MDLGTWCLWLSLAGTISTAVPFRGDWMDEQALQNMFLIFFCILTANVSWLSHRHLTFLQSFSFASLATCQVDTSTWMSLHHLKGSMFKHKVIFLPKPVLTVCRVARFSQSLRFLYNPVFLSFYIWLFIKIPSFIKSLVLTPTFHSHWYCFYPGL